jgi:hydrogenase expression/formation protein HypE
VNEFLPACPLPVSDYPKVLLAHGGGGRLMHQLIEKLMLPAFGNQLLGQQHDGAVIEIDSARLAFTTDSYVVRPLFFPGGDIGTLAINGTVNDLAMCGARPQWLSAGFIIEEGLPMETLWRVVQSMQRAAAAARIELVTGDTKVVDKGKGDGLFINTAGLGVIEHKAEIAPRRIKLGDAVLLSGDLGRHGIAIMSVREGLQFESAIESDCAPLAEIVLCLLEASVEIHCLRDLTRGGLASALNEIARAARVQIDIDESAVSVREDVQGACEILGLDPLHTANEGRLVAFVAPRDASRALDLMRAHPLGTGAQIIGTVSSGSPGLVTMKSRIGARRILDMLSGEQLPRIC